MAYLKPESAQNSSSRWPWICLLAALIWIAIVRVPLVLNAEIHLDSDLAVDGLTLLDMTHGHWRWHFPGTPYMSSLPVVLSLPGALMFGVNAMTLVVGGVIAYELFVVAMFFLVRRLFGAPAACWALIPLAFASVGTVWLSGRLSGGHLLTLAWHAAALAMLPTFAPKGGYLKAFGFGLWCGLGYSLDGMFLMTLAFVSLLALKAVFQVPGFIRKLALITLMGLGFGIGDLPREIGARVDPHDAYKEQFSTILERDATGRLDQARARGLLVAHTKLFAFECLPRLITGHRLVEPQLPTAPEPQTLAGGAPKQNATASPFAAAMVVGLGVTAFLGSLMAITFACIRVPPQAIVNLPWAILGSVSLVTLFFLISKNIYNSDNYRYLVYYLVPWSAGFGLMMARLWTRGAGGKLSSVLISCALAALFTLDTASWYRGFGWVDDWGRPVHRPLDDPALIWLRDHPEVDAIFGGYWDVYRYQFLLGGKLVGVPFPIYPDRYDTTKDFADRQPRLMVARKGEFNNFYPDFALKRGGRVLLETRERQIIDCPHPK
jgi:hypothetical protein